MWQPLVLRRNGTRQAAHGQRAAVFARVVGFVHHAKLRVPARCPLADEVF